jgi:hypothetical protein
VSTGRQEQNLSLFYATFTNNLKILPNPENNLLAFNGGGTEGALLIYCRS